MFNTAPLDHAIAAHARWKYTLRQAIESGSSDLKVDDVRAADRCPFGQFLQRLSEPDRTTEHALEVIRLHDAFHVHAAEVLALALAGQSHQALAAVASRSAFMTTSNQLTQATAAWKTAVVTGGPPPA